MISKNKKKKKEETSELFTAVISLRLHRTVLPRGCDPSASICAPPVPTSASVIRLPRQRDKRLWHNFWWRIIKQQRTEFARALQHRYPNALDAGEATELNGWSVKRHFTETLSNKMQSCRQTFMKEIKNTTVWGKRLHKWIPKGAKKNEENGPNVNVIDRLRATGGSEGSPFRKINVGRILFKRKVLLVTDFFFFFSVLNSSTPGGCITAPRPPLVKEQWRQWGQRRLMPHLRPLWS